MAVTLDITDVGKEILKALWPVTYDYSIKMYEEAQNNAPVLTGKLKSGFEAIDDGRSRRNWAGEERYYVRRRITNRVRYSIFQEEGTKKNTPKKFMRKAFLRHSLAYADRAESVCLEVVNKFNSKVS